MARSLMMIIGLSLAVVALGCPDGGDGNGTGGSGGTGGTVAGACTNADDLMMLCMPGFSDGYLTPCATNAAGDGAMTSACLQEDPPGLSADCADCEGDQVECIRDGCVLGEVSVCFPPIADQEICDACADDAGCTAAFDSCAGDIDSACAG